MSHPLALSYNWRGPVGLASIALTICISLLVHSGAHGWISVAIVLVLLWAVFIGVVWLRTRAYLRVDGTTMTVRRYRAMHDLDGRRVSGVKEYLTGHGPCYKVRLRDDQTSYHVPVALLQHGHSTFFDWVLSNAPDAELDKRSRRTVDQLRTRGLIE